MSAGASSSDSKLRGSERRIYCLLSDGTPSLMRKYPKAHFLRAPAEAIDPAIAELDA